MASIDITKFGETVTVTNKGVAAVADSSKYWAGAEAWLSNGSAQQRARITSIVDATHIQLRAIPEDQGGNVNSLTYAAGSDLSAYTRIDMPGQTIRIDPALTVRKSIVPN
jgi:hypothetical protein